MRNSCYLRAPYHRTVVISIYLGCLVFGLAIAKDSNVKKNGEGFKKISLNPLNGETKSNWFGHIGEPLQILEFNSFPSSFDFFYNFVSRSIPVKIKGADLSPAQTRWTDDYFMTKQVPKDERIKLETLTKDGADQSKTFMHLHDYMKIYNKSDLYWVQPVPNAFLSDLVLPNPLQCELLKDSYVSHHIWFSSVGTKSTVHTDSAENIICVYRGSKDVVLVDPYIYGDQVNMDHPERGFCGVDVDNVNYTAYPGLSNVQYHHVTMDKGDCLYVPFNWIHQIRSHGPHIGVTIWWNHHKSQEIDFTECTQEPSKDLTLDKFEFNDYDERNDKLEHVREQLLFFSKTTWDSNFENLCKLLIVNVDENDHKMMDKFKVPVRKIFDAMDRNKDGKLKRREIFDATEEDWDVVSSAMQEYISVFTENMLDPDETTEIHDAANTHDEF